MGSCGANRRELEDQSAIKGKLEIKRGCDQVGLSFFERTKRREEKRRREEEEEEEKKGMESMETRDLYGDVWISMILYGFVWMVMGLYGY